MPGTQRVCLEFWGTHPCYIMLGPHGTSFSLTGIDSRKATCFCVKRLKSGLDTSKNSWSSGSGLCNVPHPWPGCDGWRTNVKESTCSFFNAFPLTQHSYYLPTALLWWRKCQRTRRGQQTEFRGKEGGKEGGRGLEEGRGSVGEREGERISFFLYKIEESWNFIPM